jgi:hypothetical protein
MGETNNKSSEELLISFFLFPEFVKLVHGSACNADKLVADFQAVHGTKASKRQLMVGCGRLIIILSNFSPFPLADSVERPCLQCAREKTAVCPSFACLFPFPPLAHHDHQSWPLISTFVAPFSHSHSPFPFFPLSSFTQVHQDAALCAGRRA